MKKLKASEGNIMIYFYIFVLSGILAIMINNFNILFMNHMIDQIFASSALSFIILDLSEQSKNYDPA